MNNISSKYPEYSGMMRKKKMFFIIFTAISILVAFLTLGINRYVDLSFVECFEILIDHITGNPSTHGNDDFVIWERMLPRAILGICVGAALGLGGAVMQIILHNPLADPYNTGISSGAGLGASLFLVLGISLIPGLSFFNSVVINAFIFSLIPCALIIIFSQFRKMTPSQMILVGISVMFFFGAANTVMMLAADPIHMKDAYLWTMGNLGNAEWEYLPLIVSVTIIGCVLLFIMKNQLKALNIGDTYAQTIGVNATSVRRWSLAIVSLMVSVVVSFSGTIGFVGLVAPHIARMVIGSDTKYLFPSSMAVGAAIMLLADAAAKLLILPVGVITSIIGAPLFLFILIKMRKREYA